MVEVFRMFKKKKIPSSFTKKKKRKPTIEKQVNDLCLLKNLMWDVLYSTVELRETVKRKLNK